VRQVRAYLHYDWEPQEIEEAAQDASVGLHFDNTIRFALLILNSRLADLDEKLEGILDHLTASQVNIRTQRCTPDRYSIAGTSSESAANSAAIAAIPSINATGVPLPGLVKTVTSSQDGWMTRLGLDQPLVDHLLERYRSMQHLFPFVRIQIEWSVSSMLESQPFLLLAAVTTAASQYPQLQGKLAEEIKSVVASRVLISGDNSLDLLNGLLVHLAW